MVSRNANPAGRFTCTHVSSAHSKPVSYGLVTFLLLLVFLPIIALGGTLEDHYKLSSTVLVQRELDKSILQLRESLAFGKEVFLCMGEFWISPVGDRVGWAVQNGPPQR